MNSQTLSLRQEQGQYQLLAPQLRQSLEMLQAPVLELRALIQKELQQNPVLQEKGTEDISLEGAAKSPDKIDEKHENDEKELNFRKEFEILMRLDRETYDYFMQGYEPYGADDEKRRNYALEIRSPEESLQEHLTRQLAFMDLPERDRKIGELIIGSINEDGYLTQSVEELAASTGYEPSDLYDVLAVIRDFDPVGVGARDLKECLLIQLQRLGQDSSLAAGIVNECLELLASKNYSAIAHKLNVKVEDVRVAAKLIAALDPKPGLAFGAETPAYVFPDVIVEKGENGYFIMLNDEQIPSLHISKHYRQMMDANASSEEVKKYIRDKVRSGLFLIKSIDQRQQTIRRVAMEIVKAQTDFLDSGVAHLKPLTMAEIAGRVGLHETTVCRCVANKFMKTPQGVFEMKYFFTPGLKNSNGEVVSNKAVQDLIAGMVAEEDGAKPLSDQEIFERLSARGLQVARRTVAKYRLALKIPPSYMRKSD